ncbi:MAG: AAA family ATPase, partial [Candidatus Omnitrophota bacterium]
MKRRGIFRINKNFRILATMNPIDYAGRNILSPALMNRFKVKWVDEPSGLELQAVFNEKFRDADGSPMLPWGVMDRMEWLHSRIKNVAEARRIGFDERDPYYYSIRDIIKTGKRTRARVDEKEKETGAKVPSSERIDILVSQFTRVYTERIRDDDDRRFVEGVIRDTFGNSAGAGMIEPPVIKEDSLTLGGVRLNKCKNRGPYVPGKDSVLFSTRTTNKYLAFIAEMIDRRECPLLTGPTGAAKTSLVRYLAYLTGNSFMRINLDAQTDTSEIIGGYVPEEDKAGEFKWRDGLLVRALKNGYWVLLDELNLAEPEILERINSLLDDDGSLVITEHENEIIMSAGEYEKKLREHIRNNFSGSAETDKETRRLAMEELKEKGIFCVHPDFRLFTAMNPERYSGRNRMSLALRNKLSEMWISGEMDEDEYEVIIKGYLTAESPERDKTVKAIIKLHTATRDIAEYLDGGSIDKYQFSMRDVKALCGFINKYSETLPWDEAFSKGIKYVYYDRMTTKKDKDHFLETAQDILVKRVRYKNAYTCLREKCLKRKIQEGDRALIKNPGRGGIKILDTYLDRNPAPVSKELVPAGNKAELVLTDSTVSDLEKAAQAAALNEPLLFVGDTGAGKTSLIRYLAYLTNNAFQRINLSGQTEKTDFIGGYHPDEAGRFVWRDGLLIEAMKKGQWFVIDEINLAPSQIIERINSLLDDDGFLVVAEHKGE